MGRQLIHSRGRYWVVETVSGDEHPVTPKFKTKKELGDHLVTHGEDTPFGKKDCSRKAIDAFLRISFCPSMMVGSNGMVCNYECCLFLERK